MIISTLRMCKLDDAQVCDHTYGTSADEDLTDKAVYYQLQSAASAGLSSMFFRATLTVFTKDTVCQYVVTQMEPWME